MTKVLSKTTIKATSISLLFFFSSIGASVLINPASAAPNSPAALAATPLTLLQANWASPNGNVFGQDYNPQNIINSSNAQYLGLNWLFPLPTHPTALLSVTGGLGVDTALLIINGTVYATTQYGQVFALNAANGNVLWTTVLPLLANSTAGQNAGNLSLHLHDGEAQFTTALFNHTPTYWISAPDHKVYALNALTGAYEMNFSYYGKGGVTSVAGNNPNSVYTSLAPNILIDQNKGIMISSMLSSSSNSAARCFYRGWNILVNPPQLMWTAFCSPPQVGSNIPVNPNWDIQQVNNMTGAEIFYTPTAYYGGGTIPGTAVVNLKTLSPSVLNATLYNDWGQIQSAACLAQDGGGSPGGLGSGWGAQWLLGTGPTAGMMFVNTGNRGPYVSGCNPGPDLWASAVMALNENTGQWVWGFQTSAHDEWDWDCSWWQALGNETISGVNTQVLWKTCKNGYLYELNAVNGNLIWAYTPPQNIMARCQYCFMLDPLNRSQMTEAFGNPNLTDTLVFPTTHGGFENEGSYSPALNYIFTASQNYPGLEHYIPFNASSYGKTNGFSLIATAASALSNANTTIEAINAATGQAVWTHFVAGFAEGYRGGITNSGGVVFLTFSSGDVLMLNAATGATIKDLYIGGPLNNLPSIGATSSGQMEVIFPITAGSVTWGTGVPGDIVALSLQNVPIGSVSTVTSISTTISTLTGTKVTTTSVSTVTAAGASGGVSTTTAYGIAAVAVIFIIATGYLAMRGRKPAS
jgi:outer membrane protein assembly factor BamB